LDSGKIILAMLQSLFKRLGIFAFLFKGDKMKYRLSLLLVVILLLLNIFGCSQANHEKYSGSFFDSFDTYKKKGLYGRKNALDLAVQYYARTLDLWKSGDFSKSLFYFGAAVHLIQDMSIPQHANIRLLDNHKQYETFVKRSYQYVHEFRAEKDAYLLDTIEEYIRFNARVALKIHKRFKSVSNDEQRYYLITKCNLPLCQKTTAGAMIMLYQDLFGEGSLH
jgi:hypothetical protein